MLYVLASIPMYKYMHILPLNVISKVISTNVLRFGKIPNSALKSFKILMSSNISQHFPRPNYLSYAIHIHFIALYVICMPTIVSASFISPKEF